MTKVVRVGEDLAVLHNDWSGSMKGPEGEKYVQACPNVIYELGWFCGRLGRNRVILLLREGTSVFSDFGGVIQKHFKTNVAERIEDIRKDLAAAGVLS